MTSRDPLKTLSALTRWHGFREKVAGDQYQKAEAEAIRASEAYGCALNAITEVQDRRLCLLNEMNLDIGRMELYAQMENVAREKGAEKARDLDDARENSRSALDSYTESRAKTRVADGRLERVRVMEGQRAERRLFDLMVELRCLAQKDSP